MEQIRAIPPVFALAGFATSALSGISRGASGGDGLTSALMAMAVCYAVGGGAAWVLDRVLREHTAARRAARASAGGVSDAEHQQTGPGFGQPGEPGAKMM